MTAENRSPVDASITEIGLIVERNRAEIARQRRLPTEIEQAFLDFDVYRLLVPADLGGAGITPLDQLDYVERIAYHDASAAWNFAVGSGLGMLSGFLPRAEVEAIFTRDGAAMAGSAAPQGRAERVDGGYIVNGRFAWASGIDQAKWVAGGCIVTEGGRTVEENGKPVAVFAIASKAEAVVHDCWDVGGLVATNSTEFSLTDVFVPARRTLPIPWTQRTHPAPLFRLPMTFFGFALTGVPLGVARRAVEGLRTLAVQKQVPGRGMLSDDGYVRYAVAKAQVLMDAARANLHASFEPLWAAALDEREVDTAARARLRRACVHAAESGIEAVNLCYRAAGGSALFSTAPFEAALRDVNAMSGHLVFQRRMMEEAGGVAFGAEPTLSVF